MSVVESVNHRILKLRAIDWILDRGYTTFECEYGLKLKEPMERRGYTIYEPYSYITKQIRIYIDVAVPKDKLAIECGITQTWVLDYLLEDNWEVYHFGYRDNEPIRFKGGVTNLVVGLTPKEGYVLNNGHPVVRDLLRGD
jgi:hypothetical protein